jgi:hypothetical protein
MASSPKVIMTISPKYYLVTSAFLCLMIVCRVRLSAGMCACVSIREGGGYDRGKAGNAMDPMMLGILVLLVLVLVSLLFLPARASSR